MARIGAAGAGATINTARPSSTARAADISAQTMHGLGGSAKQRSQQQHLQQLRRYDQPNDNQGMLSELDYRYPHNSGGVALYEQTLRQFRSLEPTPHPSNNNPISHRPITRKTKDNSLNSTIKRGPNFQQGPPSKGTREAQNASNTNRSIQKNKSNF